MFVHVDGYTRKGTKNRKGGKVNAHKRKGGPVHGGKVKSYERASVRKKKK